MAELFYIEDAKPHDGKLHNELLNNRGAEENCRRKSRERLVELGIRADVIDSDLSDGLAESSRK